MIILLLGGIGSGKSVSAIKEIIDHKEHYAITNFNVSLPKDKFHRLKFSDILKEKEGEENNNGRRCQSSASPTNKKFQAINWEFWDGIRKKHNNFSVYLDEVHNIIHARSSMSKRNILMSKWISQIRKILSDNPVNHIYLISQTIRKIDVDFRELAQVIIDCSKITHKGNIYIIRKYYSGIDAYMNNRTSAKSYFLANPYFKHYNTNEMVTFGDADIYV